MENRIEWDDKFSIISPSISWICYRCENRVAQAIALKARKDGRYGYNDERYVVFCPGCGSPTYITQNGSSSWQSPAPSYGQAVHHLKDKQLEALFGEARDCVSVRFYTAAVLCCRKLLMHVAVDLGADRDQGFAHYIDYLISNNHVTPAATGWLKAIKDRGNEQNHEIRLARAEEAKDILDFCTMLLQIIYEYPARAKEHEQRMQQKSSG